VQLGRVPPAALAAAVPVGLVAVALLLANNIRDLDGDRRAGKRTLAVLLGGGRARALFEAVVAGAFVAVVLLGVARPAALAALAAVPLAVRPVRLVRHGDGPALLAALAGTARLQLAVGVLLAAGLWVS
jgi:1,4-dihydroxy-2-naphthoate polyprenyltransferase